MRNCFVLIAIALSVPFAYSQNAIPVITNLSTSFDDGNKQITVNFDLADNESDDVEIIVTLSDNYGETFLAEVLNLMGDAGYPVSPGPNKQVIFNYTPSLQPVPGWMIKITADDHQTVDIQQMVDQVDSVLLREDLSFIEGIRHYQTDTVHLEEVKEYIEDEFRRNNLLTYRQDFLHNGYNASNVISWMPGVRDERIMYIVDAHFDSVSNSPGADDNGSGTAGVLEAVRILSQYKFEHTIKFIGFDFEESSPTLGLTGSLKYVTEGIKSHEQLEGVFNFEMIGYYSEKPNTQQVPANFDIFYASQYQMVASDSFKGNFIVNTANTTSSSLGMVFSNASAQYVPELKVISFALPDAYLIETADFWRSDHASFWGAGAGYKALMLTDGANFRNHSYHTPNDTIGALNFTFMSNVVKATIAAVATLAKPVHASSGVAYLFDTGMEDIAARCNWQLAQSENEIIFFPDRNCDLNVWSIRFYDTQGKMIFQKNSVTDHLVIESLGLSAGLYFLSATNGKRTKSVPVIIR